MSERLPPAADRTVAVVVLDYQGVCTPSAREFIDAGNEVLPPIRPELGETVEHLRSRGVTVALLSNEFDRSWPSTIDGFPEFDHVMVGADNRIFKPDRRAFERVVLVTGTEHGRVLVVDDEPTNVEAARAIGYQAVWFDTTDPAASWRRVCAAVD